jgi:hypothetical protein
LNNALDCKKSIEEAGRAVTEIEERLREVESRHNQAAAALLSIDNEVRTTRERLANLSGSREQIRQNAQQAHEARRTGLIAMRDAAARQVQGAQEVIEARAQLQGRSSELTLAQQKYQEAQQAELCAQNLFELASLLAEQQKATALVAALKVATAERDKRAKQVTDAEAELKSAETSLETGTAAANRLKDGLATAEREAAQRESRKETLRASEIRAVAGEREALQDEARANAALACSASLVEAKRSVAGLEADERDLENKLSGNAVDKQAGEAKLAAPLSLPVKAPLFLGILGGALAAALGVGFQASIGVLTLSVLASILVTGAVTAFVLGHRQRRRAQQLLLQELEDLANAREKLLERRNQVVAKRGVEQMRADAARRDVDQLMATMGEPEAGLAKARSGLQEARRELESIRKDLAILKGHDDRKAAITPAQVEEAEQACMLLKEDVSQKKRLRDEARHQLAEAQVRFEAASSSAGSVELAGLEKQVNAAREKVPGAVPPDPNEAQTRLQLTKRAASDLETAMKVARERLSDTRSRFEEMSRALGQPADQIRAEAEKKREDAEKTLASLKETNTTAVAAAEKEFREVEAEVARLGAQQTAAQAEAETAMQVRDQTRKTREQALARLEALRNSVPNTSVTEAEAVLAQTRSELESHPGGSPADSLAAVESLLEQQQAELRTKERELAEARGELRSVGGSVAREERDRLREAFEASKRSAEDLELEYRAAWHLLKVLKEEEGKRAAHLGRTLAKPVTEIFSKFTCGRYAQIVLDSGLRFQSVMAKGGERELGSLSVGTRDQLATLVRLALAAQLKSVVVLDDQLAQSDERRLNWFREQLRASVRDHDHQIIVITCRLSDYVYKDEMPVSAPPRYQTEDGMLTVMDLERIAAGG